jgi:hypothetical protein
MTNLEQKQDPEWVVLLIGLIMIALLQSAAVWAATSHVALGLGVGAAELLGVGSSPSRQVPACCTYFSSRSASSPLGCRSMGG